MRALWQPAHESLRAVIAPHVTQSPLAERTLAKLDAMEPEDLRVVVAAIQRAASWEQSASKAEELLLLFLKGILLYLEDDILAALRKARCEFNSGLVPIIAPLQIGDFESILGAGGSPTHPPAGVSLWRLDIQQHREYCHMLETEQDIPTVDPQRPQGTSQPRP